MKAVLMSIHPKWCEKIFNEEKTIEVRKTAPKIETPFMVYVYETKGKTKYWSQPMSMPYTEGRGKVIGSFVCDRVENIFNVATTSWSLLDGNIHNRHKELVKNACLTEGEIHEYSRGRLSVFAWHITDTKLFDKPRNLSEFGTYKTEWVAWYGSDDLVFHPLTRPPQSWCYVEEHE